MKKLFSILLVLVLVLDVAATTLKVNSRNFTSEPTQRRRITITLVEAGPVVADPWLIAGDSVSQFTDTNGVSYFSNVLAGSYKLAIAGSPGRLFPITVFDTNAVLDASALVNSTNYNTAFYTATQVDALIAAGGGGGGTNYGNDTGLPGVVNGSNIGTNLATLATDAELLAATNSIYTAANTYSDAAKLGATNKLDTDLRAAYAAADLVVTTAGDFTNHFGFNGERWMNSQNLPRLRHRLQSHLPLRLLYWGDDAITGSSELHAHIVSNLSITMPRNGAVTLSPSYLYTAGNGTYHAADFTDTLFPNGYWGLASGTGFTNVSDVVTTGFPMNRIVVNYWAANGYGTLTVSTQTVSGATYGAKGTVAVINANNGGSLTAMTTNIDVSLSTGVASIAGSVATNNVAYIGQYKTNVDAGFIYDIWDFPGADWSKIASVAGQSNSFRAFFANYDAIIVSDKGSPQNGATAAESMILSAGLPVDLIYITQPPNTNILAESLTDRSNFVQIGILTGRPILDPGSIFLSGMTGPAASLTDLMQYYTADGVHLAASGARVVANHIMNRLELSPGQIRNYGYTNRYDTTDTSGKANLAGGNAFTGAQTLADPLWIGSYVTSTGSVAGFTMRDRSDNNTAGTIYINGTAWRFYDSNTSSDWMTASNVAGIYQINFAPYGLATKTLFGNQSNLTMFADSLTAYGTITNNGLIWHSTNTTPTYAYPNGSLASVSDGRLYMRTNGAWSIFAGGGGGDALVANPLSQFASTTSAQLRGVLSDESGTGVILTANGDGSSLTAIPALTGDVTSSGLATTIAANSVALGTDSTGNYIATIADSGASEVTVSGSGSETAAVTLALASGITRDTEIDTIAEVEAIWGRKVATNNGTMTASTLLIGDGARGITTTTTGSGVLTALANTAGGASGFLLYDAELAALGGLTSAADKIPYFTGSGTAGLVTIGTGLSFSSGTLSATSATQYFYTNSVAASSISNAFNVKIDGNLDVTGTLGLSNLNTTNFFLNGLSNAPLWVFSDSSVSTTNEGAFEAILDLQDLQGAVTDAQVPNTITVDAATLAGTVTVIDGTDATSFVAIFDSATGSLAAKTDGGLTYAADSGTLSATVLTEGANAVYNSSETPGGELGGTWASPTLDDSVAVSSWVLTSPTITTGITPTSNDGAALGTTSFQFSDLYLAEGGVINWDAGDATLTQSGNTVTLAGADLSVSGAITATGLINALSYESATNQWVTNTVITLGTNTCTATLSANTGGGITGILNAGSTTERFAQLFIKATGDVTFTNPAAFYTSDYADTRVITNANTAWISIDVIPGVATNLAIVQFK